MSEDINKIPDYHFDFQKFRIAQYFPLIALIAAFLMAQFFWFSCRIEPREGEIAVLVKKTGKTLPSGEILATSKKFKGIQLDVLPEGRYFRNPYTWSWYIKKMTDIPAGKLGVLTRLYGEELPPGQIIAKENQKGVLREILSPGKYRINPYAYRVQLVDAINIQPGFVGVVTSLVGEDVLYGKPKNVNTFLVNENEKGVQNWLLDPGTHYLNPHIYSVAEVDLRSQRFQMSGEDAIVFLSMDGFEIMVEGTIEWAIEREKVPLITHRVGDLEDIQRKIILPHARGFMRTEGSKKPAVDYILGETRKQFQDNLFAHLKEACATRGVIIKSTLIRNIKPPDEIAGIIREREVAVQNRNMYERQIEEARSRAELMKQEMLAEQKKEKVAQETIQKKAVISAQQQQAVATMDANKKLGVAKLAKEAAVFDSESILSKGQADRDVIDFQNKAEAEVLRNRVKAFQTGDNLARYSYFKKVAPQINSVLGDEDGPLGDFFRKFNQKA